MAAHRSRKIKVNPAPVSGNRPDLAPLAQKCKLPFVRIPWNDRAQAEVRALRLLEEHEFDFVVLARVMKILPPNFVWRFNNKTLNIHPSWQPSFPGPQACRQADESGVKIAGVTTHFVSMRLDEAPIIAQGSFQIRPGMTLKDIIARGRQLEAEGLVKAVKLYPGKRLDFYSGVAKEV